MSREQQNPPNDRPRPPEALRGHHTTLHLIRQKVWKPANWRDDWCVFVIVGREGSGKSHTCLSILEKTDPTFSAERVHFAPQSFLENIHEMPKDERQGKAIMLDESGVGMGVRSWYDQDQVKVNKLMQTARDDNMIVGVTLPRLSELDSQFRGRLHGFVEMRDLVRGKYAVFSWKNVKPTRDENNKLYKQYPRLRARGGKKRVTRVAIGPPSDSLVEEYEEEKAAFKDELYEETIEGLDDSDGEDGPSPKDIAEELTSADNIADVVSLHGGHNKAQIDTELIKLSYDLGTSDARTVKKLLAPQFDQSELEGYL